MPPARVQCDFCGKTFSKRANLNRHLNSNSCAVRPNPDTVRPRCQYCNAQFKSRRVLKEHKRLKRCPGRQRQQEQDVNPQQPPLPLPSYLDSMSQQQKIKWLSEFLAKDDGRVTQNLIQSAWAMANNTELQGSVVVEGNEVLINEEEATPAAAVQQQTTSKRSA